MVARTKTQDGQVRMLSREEWIAFFDRLARRELGISGEEFIRRWESGEYEGLEERPEVMRVAMLLPSGR